MEDFSVGVLAARTGLTPGVLRTWENRYGFPEGRRKESGHRRFTDRDVQDVRRVLEARAAGVPLRVAIDSVRSQRDQADSPSVYAQLTAEFPHLRPHRLDRSMLVALSHAIEDEALARGGMALVLGSFQSGDRFDESAHRWRELARTAMWAAVVGDFTDPAPVDAEATPALVHLDPAAPMRREWSVVCLSGDYAIVLAAWQVPSLGGRDYEAFVSSEPAVVLAAARTLAGVVEAAGAQVPETARKLLAETAPAARGGAADSDRVLVRALAHVQEEMRRRS